MGLISNLNSWARGKLLTWLEGGGNSTASGRSLAMLSRRDYRLGTQKRFLRRTREGFDDNVIGNFLGLALDRSISLLFGKEVKFDFGDASQETSDTIDDIWEANNKPILLHKIAMYGGEAGTVFIKLVQDSEKLWRIIPQDPIFKDIQTDPDDDDKVIRYITQYKTTDLEGREVAKREVMTAGNFAEEMNSEGEIGIANGDPNPETANWLIQNFESSKESGGKWVLVDQSIWPFPLPPIIHWQNLPMVGTAWGMPDISDDVMELQDKSNFAISNTNRIIRLFAFPFRWSRGFGGRKVGQGGDEAELDTGPDKMPNVSSPQAEIFQLPPVGDVPGAVGHATNLRQIIFDITRNTDITSMKDRVGALTNFGLRILFFDALNKLDTKRNLYGWGLREINRRIQMFSGIEPVDCKVIWDDPLPTDETALRQNLQSDLSMGVVSKETVATKLGYDWEQEQERMANDQQQTVDIGTAIMRSFDRTGGGNNGQFERQSNIRMPMEQGANLAR